MTRYMIAVGVVSVWLPGGPDSREDRSWLVTWHAAGADSAPRTRTDSITRALWHLPVEKAGASTRRGSPFIGHEVPAVLKAGADVVHPFQWTRPGRLAERRGERQRKGQGQSNASGGKCRSSRRKRARIQRGTDGFIGHGNRQSVDERRGERQRKEQGGKDVG